MRRQIERRRGLTVDPKVAQLLEESVENRAALTKRQRRDRSRTKATYDISPDVQALVQKISAMEESSTSQVVEWLLTFACNEYLQANPEVIIGFRKKEISRTPRFTYNLLTPEAPKLEAMRLLQLKQPPHQQTEPTSGSIRQSKG
jgi:hypothetical protein